MTKRRCFIQVFITVGAVAGAVSSSAKLDAQYNAALESKFGFVIAVDGSDIDVQTSSGRLTVRSSPSTKIWRGDDNMAMSVIRVGDEVAARGVSASSEMLLATEIWANITKLDGVIRRVNGNDVEIDAARNDLAPETKLVRLTDKTLGSRTLLLKRQDVQVDRTVMVIGLALEDGTVQAYRFVVHVNGRAVDSAATKYRDPYIGEISDKSRRPVGR